MLLNIQIHLIAQQILKTEGPKGFYKGVIPRLGRVVLSQGIIFMSYESIADSIRKAMEKYT